jgi:predicted GNAT family acetyltransferase
VAGGERASVAWSVRENATAAELAVETAVGHRRRGYGRQVTAAWAQHVIGQGKTAFYSYAEENVGSRALARSLSVLEFSTVAAYD